ncbi:hypothetical protein [Peredibacter starrii]|uniref:Uncharacterized protein n=1 Tax=Peredibacter starrii TaxID=28202 RepID=A0AAX4HPU1_9BACT|nr:hypothetical protein [Peredibacter starrii]WPU65142.1 hypothetical protein SOO65_00060 [Peredibacter starrii]
MKYLIFGMTLLFARASFAKEAINHAIQTLQSISECPIVHKDLTYTIIDHKCVDEKYEEAIDVLEADGSLSVLVNELKASYYNVSETGVSISNPPKNDQGEATGYTGYVYKFNSLGKLIYLKEQEDHVVSKYTESAINGLKLLNYPLNK